MKKSVLSILAITLLLVWGVVSCDDGVKDWNSSARITGYVFTDATHTVGVPGVRVILEADPDAENPYQGPDHWTATDATGRFEGVVFLGHENGNYQYVAELRVAYFWHNKVWDWGGGITVSAGSSYELPPVDTSMFVPITNPTGP